MNNPTDVKAAEETFFSSLVIGDAKALRSLLTDDFQIIDVMSGRLVDKATFVNAIEAKQLKFRTIDPAGDASIRLYERAAVVTGRTTMKVTFAGQDFDAQSRYTHVYVQMAGGWKLASAQGTPIRD